MLKMRSLPFQLLNLPMLVLFAVFVGSVSPPMATSQPKLRSWSNPREKPTREQRRKEVPLSEQQQ